VPQYFRPTPTHPPTEGLPAPLAELLGPDERRALLARARALGAAERFPEDSTGMRYPWPLV
jgi:hypothetical protein